MQDPFESDREDNRVREQAAQMTDAEAEELANEVIVLSLVWLQAFSARCANSTVMRALKETN